MGDELDSFILEQKRKINQERNKLDNSRNNVKENIPPVGADTDAGGGLLLGLGSYEDKRRRLQEERKKEYNQHLAEKKSRGTGKGDSKPADLPSIPPREGHAPNRERLHERHSAETRRRPVLSDDEDDAYRNRPPPRKGWATPTYEEILDKKRREEKAYRRYEDPDSYPDRGVRFDEGNLRPAKSEGHINRYDDDDDRNFRNDRDYEPSRRVRFQEDRRDFSRGYSRDPTWPSLESERDRPRRRRDDDYLMDMITQLKLKYGPELVDEVTQNLRPQNEPGYGRRRQPSPPRRQPSPPRAPSPVSSRRQPPSSTPRTLAPSGANQPFSATLLVGKETRASADVRRKEEYRRELERQIEEAKQNKKRVKDEDRKLGPGVATVDISNKKPEHAQRRPSPPRPAPVVREQLPFQPSIQTQPPPGQSPMRDFGNNYGLSRPPGGILDNGWGNGLYGAPMMQPYNAPPGAYGSPGLGQPYMSPLDEAYYFYANRNPLDAGQGAGMNGPGVGSMAGPRVPEPPSAREPEPRFQPGQDSTTPRMQPPRQANRNTARGGPGFGTGDEDQKTSRVEQQRLYQEELKRQMEEQKQKKQNMREEEERYNRKLEEEIQNYDPFGRGGAGAPMRDNMGNIVADRRKIKDITSPTNTPRNPPPVVAAIVDPLGESFNREQPGELSGNYARGGNGIFGEPKTNQQKSQQQLYQEELKRQIDEKKRRQDEEKSRLDEEERKMMAKINEDQEKIKQEMEAERRKEREKAEAAQRQQEELRRQQEERKKEEDRKRKEEDGKRLDELRQKQEEERRQRDQERAGRMQSPVIPALRNKESDEPPSSPPLPTMQKKTDEFLFEDARNTDSPPVPTLRNQDIRQTDSPPVPSLQNQDLRNTDSPPVPTLNNQDNRTDSPVVPAARKHSGTSSPPSRADSGKGSRVPSADVLKQLARMRQQLRSEKERVETDLTREKAKPTVYDPRVPSNGNSKGDLDIFEIARNKEPVSVRRGRDNSRTSTDNLEFKQRQQLKKQEEELAQMKKKSPYERAMPGMDPKDLGIGRAPSAISANMLESESAFIEDTSLSLNLRTSRSPSPISNGTYTVASPQSNATYTIQQDDDDFPNGVASRSETPKSKGISRASPRPGPDPMKVGSMVSMASLDPDAINARNEARLRKLKALSGDNVSTGDPDDILERFMASQKHKRPPSGLTLLDDTWLQAG